MVFSRMYETIDFLDIKNCRCAAGFLSESSMRHRWSDSIFSKSLVYAAKSIALKNIYQCKKYHHHPGIKHKAGTPTAGGKYSPALSEKLLFCPNLL